MHEPFAVGTTVSLKAAPATRFTVLKITPDVDWRSPQSTHLQPIEGDRQHYYTLLSSTGVRSHWWHSQLRIAPEPRKMTVDER